MGDEDPPANLRSLVQEQVAKQLAPLQDWLSSIMTMLQTRPEASGGKSHGSPCVGMRSCYAALPCRVWATERAIGSGIGCRAAPSLKGS